jgi:hypothetical protein
VNGNKVVLWIAFSKTRQVKTVFKVAVKVAVKVLVIGIIMVKMVKTLWMVIMYTTVTIQILGQSGFEWSICILEWNCSKIEWLNGL